MEGAPEALRRHRSILPYAGPNWLRLVALLHGQRPPVHPHRVLDVGALDPAAAVAVAAAHPELDVIIVRDDPTSREEFVRAEGPPNLRVAGRGSAVTDGPSQFLTLGHDEVSSWAMHHPRRQWLSDRMGPGALVLVARRTLTVWPHLDSLRTLLGVARRDGLDDERISELLSRLQTLAPRALVDDPIVGPLAAMAVTGRVREVEAMLAEAVVPGHSLATARELFGPIGAMYLGDACVALAEGLGLSPALRELVGDTRDPELRAAMLDAALAKGVARDVFRFGAAPMTADEQRSELLATAMVRHGGPDASRCTLGELLERQLDLGADPISAARELLAGGVYEPAPGLGAEYV